MYFRKTLNIILRKVFLSKTFSGLNLFFMCKPVSKHVRTGFNLPKKSNSGNIQTSFIIVLPIIDVKLLISSNPSPIMIIVETLMYCA